MPFDGAMEARRLPTSSQPNRVIDLPRRDLAVKLLRADGSRGQDVVLRELRIDLDAEIAEPPAHHAVGFGGDS